MISLYCTQSAEERRQKFHFCRLSFAVNVMLEPLFYFISRVDKARFSDPISRNKFHLKYGVSKQSVFEQSKQPQNAATGIDKIRA